MNAQPNKNSPSEVATEKDPIKVTDYQTNKVPWQIYAMWVVFIVAGIIYLIRFALPDIPKLF